MNALDRRRDDKFSSKFAISSNLWELQRSCRIIRSVVRALHELERNEFKLKYRERNDWRSTLP